jgi:Tol biopolymer transport system component
VIYDVTNPENQTTIWKVNINGGSPVQIIDVESGRPEISPDGRFIACDYGETGAGRTAKLAIVPIEGGEPARLLDAPQVLRSRVFKWSADGRSIVYVFGENKVDNLWSQPIEGGRPTRITDFESERIFRFSVAYPSGSFVLTRGNETSDVVTISNFN